VLKGSIQECLKELKARAVLIPRSAKNDTYDHIPVVGGMTLYRLQMHLR
jgi:hypothetical protein